ncbi:MAG: alpha/beta hydrolase [Candidatus Levybacteria bacterium]|nr:alpha/beta hydrolase [Candidatus Levybacteria bacterium]
MKQSIIILHGWGLNGSKYNQLLKILKNKGFAVYSPDLPGFGSEPLKSKSMKLDDYMEFIDNYIKKNKIENPILIGHSFGGRIALKYGWEYPKKVSRIILTGTPVIRNKTLFKKFAYLIAILGGKVFKNLFFKETLRKSLYFLLGEWDYYKAGSLNQVFKNIIGEDLIKYFKEIKVPVFLIWGEKDMITPINDVNKMTKIRNDVKSIIVPGIGHKLPYERPDIFVKSIESFI